MYFSVPADLLDACVDLLVPSARAFFANALCVRNSRVPGAGTLGASRLLVQDATRRVRVGPRSFRLLGCPALSAYRSPLMRSVAR